MNEQVEANTKALADWLRAGGLTGAADLVGHLHAEARANATRLERAMEREQKLAEQLAAAEARATAAEAEAARERAECARLHSHPEVRAAHAEKLKAEAARLLAQAESLAPTPHPSAE